MSVSLNEILDLVGPLDDTAGDDTPRERFRRFLRKNVHEVGEIRDHIEQCLRTSGEQYNRALQDLVNYAGEFLGLHRKLKTGRRFDKPHSQSSKQKAKPCPRKPDPNLFVECKEVHDGKQ